MVRGGSISKGPRPKAAAVAAEAAVESVDVVAYTGVEVQLTCVTCQYIYIYRYI